ncbi:MAG: hypothetical protein JSS62_07050 [Verrucomicrobia bacterium]|nr:hypothetical protein [Verrucomicrobiota bacterium]MBS0646738.1 hypothetical protein [Verrucomicrobiota bacterium]
MFISSTACHLISQEEAKNSGCKIVSSITLDAILGIALLVIGAVSTQCGFLPSHLQYAFIGAGAAYTVGTLCALGVIITFARQAE